MPCVQDNDVKLHYEMEGSGPPLLMVAGTGLPGATWRTGPSAQYAAEGFTVITFDHRGTGSSDKPDMDYSTRAGSAQLLEYGVSRGEEGAPGALPEAPLARRSVDRCADPAHEEKGRIAGC